MYDGHTLNYGMEKTRSYLDSGDYNGAIEFLDRLCTDELSYFYLHLVQADLLYEHGGTSEDALRRTALKYKAYLSTVMRIRSNPSAFRALLQGVEGPISREDLSRAEARIAEIEQKIGPVNKSGSAAAIILCLASAFLFLH